MRQPLAALASLSFFFTLAGCGGSTIANIATPGPPATTYQATVSTAAISFQGTAVGTTTPAQTATLTNTGTGTLSVTGITLSGANASLFAVTNNCPASLPATGNNTSCTISVTFTPVNAATATATITVATNATAGNQTIAITGNSTIVSQCKTTVPRKPNPSTTSNYAGATFTGKVLAGTLPMIGASVQLYAAGNAGNGSTPTALGSAITTDSAGAFSMTTAYTCPFNLSTLYLVARGGKPGASGAVNSGAVLMTTLGTCASLTTGSSFIVNEATTVASAYALSQFLVAGAKAGASSTNFSGLQLAAGTAINLVNPKTGASPGATFPVTGTPPSAFVNTLANALNACIVGGSASSACTQFYASVATGVSTIPSNTLDAVLTLAKSPGSGANVFTLAAASTAYGPVLTAAPSDWTMFVTYGGGGLNGPSGLGVDSNGNIWVASYFSAASYFSNTGTPLFANGITGNYLFESYGLAVDQSDNAWIPNEQGPYGINGGIGSVTVLNTAGTSAAGATGYSAGGLNFPVSIAIDTGAYNWIVDYGNSHITILKPDGSPVSGTLGYTTDKFAFPVAVAVDANCYGYVANQSGSTITRVALDGTNFASFPTGSGASGVAVDGSNNVWVANYYGNSVGLLASNGTVVSSGLAGGGVNHPQGIAIDGGGNAWVANYRGPSITKLAGATAPTPGAALSPAAGFGPDANLLEAFAIAIDAGGNLWITNFGNNTITEFVGMAVPVKTPLFGPVVQP